MANTNNINYKTWIKNFGKSVGKSSITVLKEVMPETTRIAGDARTVVDDIRNYISDNKSKMDTVDTQVAKTKLAQSANSIIQDTVRNIQSGDFANINADYDMSDFGSDIGMDLAFDDIIGDEDSDSAKNRVSNDSKVVAAATLESGNRTIDAISKMAANISKTNVATTNATLKTITNMSMLSMGKINATLMGTNKRLDNISAQMGSMIKFMNENQSKTNQASLAHYKRVEEMLLKQAEMMELAYNPNGGKKKKSSDHDMIDFGFDMEKYMKGIKKKLNSSDMISMMSMIGTMGGMASSMGMKASDMFNPLEMLLNGGVRKMMPKKATGALRRFDKNISEKMLNALVTAGDYGANNIGIKGELAKIFGIDAGKIQKANMGNYNKNAVAWSGSSKKALEEVIPHYLASMDASLNAMVKASGISKGDASYFDYSKGIFRTKSQIDKLSRDRFTDLKKQSYSNSLSSVRTMGNYANGQSRLTQTQITSIQKALNSASKKAMFRDKTGKQQKMPQIQKELASKIRSIGKGMITDAEIEDLMSTFAADTARARVNFGSRLSNSISNDYDYSLFRQAMSDDGDEFGNVSYSGFLGSLAEETTNSRRADKRREDEKLRAEAIKRDAKIFSKRFSDKTKKSKFGSAFDTISSYYDTIQGVPNKLDAKMERSINTANSMLNHISVGDFMGMENSVGPKSFASNLRSAAKSQYGAQTLGLTKEDAIRAIRKMKLNPKAYEFTLMNDDRGTFVFADVILEKADAGYPVRISASDISDKGVSAAAYANTVRVTGDDSVGSDTASVSVSGKKKAVRDVINAQMKSTNASVAKAASEVISQVTPQTGAREGRTKSSTDRSSSSSSDDSGPRRAYHNSIKTLSSLYGKKDKTIDEASKAYTANMSNGPSVADTIAVATVVGSKRISDAAEASAETISGGETTTSTKSQTSRIFESVKAAFNRTMGSMSPLKRIKQGVTGAATGGLIGMCLSPIGPVGGALIGLGAGILDAGGAFKEMIFGSDKVYKNGIHEQGILQQFKNTMQTQLFDGVSTATANFFDDMKSYSHKQLDKPMTMLFGKFSNKILNAGDEVGSGVQKAFNMLLHPVRSTINASNMILSKVLQSTVSLAGSAARGVGHLGISAIASPIRAAAGMRTAMRNGLHPSSYLKEVGQSAFEGAKSNIGFAASALGKSGGLISKHPLQSFSNIWGNGARAAYRDEYSASIADDSIRTRFLANTKGIAAKADYAKVRSNNRARTNFTKMRQKYAAQDKNMFRDLSDAEYKKRLNKLKQAGADKYDAEAFGMIENADDLENYIINRKDFMKSKTASLAEKSDKESDKNYKSGVLSLLSGIFNWVTKGKADVDPSAPADNVKTAVAAYKVDEKGYANAEANAQSEFIDRQQESENKADAERKRAERETAETATAVSLGGRKDPGQGNMADPKSIEKAAANSDTSKDHSFFGKIGSAISGFFKNPGVMLAAEAGIAALLSSPQVRAALNNILSGLWNGVKGLTNSNGENKKYNDVQKVDTNGDGVADVEKTTSYRNDALSNKINPLNFTARALAGKAKVGLIKSTKAAVETGVLKATSTSLIGKTATKLVDAGGSLVKKLVSTASTWMTKFAESKIVTKLLGENGTAIMKQVTSKAGGILSKIVSAPAKILNPFVDKITKALAKAGIETTAAVVTGGAMLAIGTGIDAVAGFNDTANLFQVAKKDVNGKMRTISTLLSVMLGFGALGPIIDVANEITSAVSGINFKRELAILIYNFWCDSPLGNDQDKAALADAQSEMDAAYAEYQKSHPDSEMGEDAFIQQTNKGWIGKSLDRLFGRTKTKTTSLNNTDTTTTTTTTSTATVSNSGSYSDDPMGYGPAMQNDARWARKKLGRLPNGKSATMANAGCGPTALANAASALGKRVNPSNVADFAKKNGFLSQGGANAGLFTKGASKYGLSGRTVTNSNQVLKSLKSGKPVILSGQTAGYGSPYTSAGHLITARGLTKDGRVIVDNPNKGRQILDQKDLFNGVRGAWSMSSGYGTGTGEAGDKYDGAMYFSQMDPKWGSKRLGDYTVGGAGCVVTSAAMALANVASAADRNGVLYTPSYTADIANSLSGGDFSGAVANRLSTDTGVSIKTIGADASGNYGKNSDTFKQIQSFAKARNPVILYGTTDSAKKFGNGANVFSNDVIGAGKPHAVLAIGANGEGLRVIDPSSRKKSASATMYPASSLKGLKWARAFNWKGKGIDAKADYSGLPTYADSTGVNAGATGAEGEASTASNGITSIWDSFTKLASGISTIGGDMIGAALSGKTYGQYKAERQAKEMNDTLNEVTSSENGLDGTAVVSNAKFDEEKYKTFLNSSLKNPSAGYNKPATASSLNKFLSDPYVVKNNSNSPFIGRGDAFMKASAASGLDPRAILAMAAFESGWGTSSQARKKNNFFGIGSYNYDPDNAQTLGSDMDTGLINGAKWIADHYTNAGQDTLKSMLNSNHAYCQNDDGTPTYSWANNIASIMSRQVGFGKGSNGSVGLIANARNNYGLTPDSISSRGSSSINTGVENRLDTIIDIIRNWSASSNSGYGEAVGFGPENGQTASNYSESRGAKKAQAQTQAKLATQGLTSKVTQDYGRSHLRQIHSSIATGYRK